MEMTIGKRIAAHRKRLKLTQDQLADKLGITAQAVSKWENDQSCPDISILPSLADIFNVTTDELLGHEIPATVCEVQAAPHKEQEHNGIHIENGNINLHWDGPKLGGIGLACWVLLTGAVYLFVQLTHRDVSFWNTLWPSFLLVLGLFGLYPKFSVFSLGCVLVSGFFLADKLLLLELNLPKGVLFAVLILMFGLSLLMNTLRKKKLRRTDPNHWNTCNGQRKVCNDFSIDGCNFSYDASFGDAFQQVTMEKLQTGHISVNFGDYEVDLSGVEALAENCRIHADCSFGELTLLVPRRYSVIADSSTSFAGFEFKGQPDPIAEGTIKLDADVSFGNICVQYI